MRYAAFALLAGSGKFKSKIIATFVANSENEGERLRGDWSGLRIRAHRGARFNRKVVHYRPWRGRTGRYSGMTFDVYLFRYGTFRLLRNLPLILRAEKTRS